MLVICQPHRFQLSIVYENQYAKILFIVIKCNNIFQDQRSLASRTYYNVIELTFLNSWIKQYSSDLLKYVFCNV